MKSSNILKYYHSTEYYFWTIKILPPTHQGNFNITVAKHSSNQSLKVLPSMDLGDGDDQDQAWTLWPDSEFGSFKTCQNVNKQLISR